MLPMFDYLSILYSQGGKAVELFFCISGFIFFNFYMERIANKGISAKNFFILRFSRLYPLHIVTLLAVCLMAAMFFNHSEFHFIYPENDLKHFILNLFLLSHWGFQDGTSFNGPIWSVSVEIFLYSTFFFFCLLNKPTVFKCIVPILLGFTVMQVYDSFGIAIVCFYLGGVAFYLLRWVEKGGAIETWFYSLGSSVVAMVAFVYCDPFRMIDLRFVGHTGLDVICFFVMFPLIILFMALGDKMEFRSFRRTKIIGDISYSLYLIHFPVQLLLVVYCVYSGVKIDFTLPAVFFTYLGLCIAIAYLSYRFFEVPLQTFLRKRLMRK